MLLVTMFAAGGCSTTSRAPQTAPPAAAVTTPAAPTTAAKPAVPAKDELTCQRGKEERWLSIENVQPKGCKLNYPQTTTAVAWSSFGVKHCEQVRDRIKTKLEDAGFKCAATTAASAAKAGPQPASTPAKK